MEDKEIMETPVTSYSDEEPKQEVMTPNPAPQKGKHIKPKREPKTGLMRATVAIFTIAMITGGVGLFCVASPVLFGLMILIFFCIIVLLSIVTLGLIWLEEGNRSSVGSVWDWIMGLSNYVEAFLITGIVLSSISIVTILTSLILSSIAVSKKQKGAIPILVISIIVVVVGIILVIAGASGLANQGN